MFTGSLDKKVHIWYVEDMSLLNTIEVEVGVTCLAVSCSNTFLLVGGEDGTLLVTAFTTSTIVHRLQDHHSKVAILSFSSVCCL